MIFVQPTRVTFGDVELDGVVWVSVDRFPTRRAQEWSDAGPHMVFADVAEQVVRVRVIQELEREDLGLGGGVGGASAVLGAQATLSFVTSPGGSDAARRRVSATAVLVAVSHGLVRARAVVQGGGAVRRGVATRTCDFVAVSSDGATDPIAITDAGGAA